MQHSESLAQHDRSLLLGQPVHRSTHQVATTQKNYEIFENVLQSKGTFQKRFTGFFPLRGSPPPP